MDGVLLESFLEPTSVDVPPLDFVINNHLMKKALFGNRFDPLNNDYFIGFWLAMLCTTMAGNNNPIYDVLFGILDHNRGFKTLMIVPNGASGGKNLVIRKFYFSPVAQQMPCSYLSFEEIKKISHLMRDDVEEKIVEYLVYDINGLECTDHVREKTYQPFIEKMQLPTDCNIGAVDGVKEYYSLKHFKGFVNNLLLEVSVLKDKGYYDDWIKKIFLLIVDELKKAQMEHLIPMLQEPFQYGFIHGFLFSVESTYALNLKIRAYGENPYNVSLLLQEQASIEDMKNYAPAKHYVLSGLDDAENATDDFKQKILKTIATYGNRSETGTVLREQVGSLVRSLTLEPTSRNYIATYLRGMFMTWPGSFYDYDKKSPYYDVYVRKDNMQLAIRVQYTCLLVFNFDDNLNDIDTLRLREFVSPLKENCVWLVTVTETDVSCNVKLLRRDMKYSLNIERMDLKTPVQTSVSIHHKKLFETHLVRLLLLRLDFSDEESLNNIYIQFRNVIRANVDLLKQEKAFFHILEGLFHDTSSYFDQEDNEMPQIDKLCSEIVYSVRIRMTSETLQINFMNVNHLGEYIEHINNAGVLYESDKNYKLINFFYGYDPNSGNFSTHMSVEPDFHDQLFTNSTCYDSNTNEVECELVVDQVKFDLKRNVLVPDWFKIVCNIFEAMRTNELRTEEESNALVHTANFNSIIIDDLRDPFYLLSDLIWTKILIHDTAVFVKSLKAAKTAWKLAKITFKAIASGVGVPVIGLVLASMDITDAVRNYNNGDTSALAVYNIVAAGIFLTTSLASLVIGILTLMSFNVVPVIGWIVFVVGTIFFVVGHILKIADDPEAFRHFLWSTWEGIKSIRTFINHPITYLESDQATHAAIVVSSALEIMENIAMIQNVFLTPVCTTGSGQEHGCYDIHINFDARYRFLKKDVLTDTPNVPPKFSGKYKKLCAFQTAFGVLVKIFKVLHDPHGAVIDHLCYNALGVGRIDGKFSPNAISLYILHGNSSVHAIRETASMFRLSGGQWCRIIGSQMTNNFVFYSAFRQCTIEGLENAINTLDISEVFGIQKYELVNGTSLRGVDDKSNLISLFRIRNIGTIKVRQNFEKSGFTIFCSNVSIIAAKKKHGQYFYNPFEISIANGRGCPYNLEITSHGHIIIQNYATSGRAVYYFPDVTGTVNLYLSNRMAHSVLWKSVGIVDVKDISVNVFGQDGSTHIISFTLTNHKIMLTLWDGTTSTQQMFADGAGLTFKNGTFVVDLLFPQSKGQLWYMYSRLFENFGKNPVVLNAYSERDDDFFVLSKNSIQIDQTTMPFTFFKNEQRVKCKPGYILILVTVACCDNVPTIYQNRDHWFPTMTIRMTEKLDILVIDFTLLIGIFDHFIDTNYTLDMNFHQHAEAAALDVDASFWTEEQEVTYHVGTVLFEADLRENDLYRNVKITARSNFIFSLNKRTNHLEVVPLPHSVSPLSPIVVLDRHSIQRNQAILFNNRSVTNFDLVKLSASNLLISDMASNMAKGIFLNPISVPFLIIIIKNYKHSRMQSLTLKFDNGLQLKINELDENQMIEYGEFERKIHAVYSIIKKQRFSLDYDFRFTRGKRNAHSIDDGNGDDDKQINGNV